MTRRTRSLACLPTSSCIKCMKRTKAYRAYAETLPFHLVSIYARFPVRADNATRLYTVNSRRSAAWAFHKIHYISDRILYIYCVSQQTHTYTNSLAFVVQCSAHTKWLADVFFFFCLCVLKHRICAFNTMYANAMYLCEAQMK